MTGWTPNLKNKLTDNNYSKKEIKEFSDKQRKELDQQREDKRQSSVVTNKEKYNFTNAGEKLSHLTAKEQLQVYTKTKIDLNQLGDPKLVALAQANARELEKTKNHTILAEIETAVSERVTISDQPEQAMFLRWSVMNTTEQTGQSFQERLGIVVDALIYIGENSHFLEQANDSNQADEYQVLLNLCAQCRTWTWIIQAEKVFEAVLKYQTLSMNYNKQKTRSVDGIVGPVTLNAIYNDIIYRKELEKQGRQTLFEQWIDDQKKTAKKELLTLTKNFDHITTLTQATQAQVKILALYKQITENGGEISLENIDNLNRFAQKVKELTDGFFHTINEEDFSQDNINTTTGNIWLVQGLISGYNIFAKEDTSKKTTRIANTQDKATTLETIATSTQGITHAHDTIDDYKIINEKKDLLSKEIEANATSWSFEEKTNNIIKSTQNKAEQKMDNIAQKVQQEIVQSSKDFAEIVEKIKDWKEKISAAEFTQLVELYPTQQQKKNEAEKIIWTLLPFDDTLPTGITKDHYRGLKWKERRTKRRQHGHVNIEEINNLVEKENRHTAVELGAIKRTKELMKEAKDAPKKAQEELTNMTKKIKAQEQTLPWDISFKKILTYISDVQEKIK